MTFPQFCSLSCLLGAALLSIILVYHAVHTRRHPDPQGSIWRHIFKE
jgi:hypothetical protein